MQYEKQPLWDATFESRLRAADVVLVTNMGVGLDSPFLERLERYNLQAKYQGYEPIAWTPLQGPQNHPT